MPGGASRFEVKQGHDAFTVDEENRTCTCRMWQLSGIPCPHAVAAIFYINKHPDQYVPHWFRKGLYKETYSYHLEPVQGMNQWPPNSLNKPLPPKPRIMPGRPKKKRNRAAHEPVTHVGRISRVGAIMTCKKCGGEGHNQRGCKVKEGSTQASNQTSNVTSHQDSTTVKKGKGKQNVEASNVKQTVGGFMADARTSYKPPRLNQESTQESTQAKQKGRKKKTQINYGPTRRQAQHRISKINLQKKNPWSRKLIKRSPKC